MSTWGIIGVTTVICLTIASIVSTICDCIAGKKKKEEK